MFQLVPPEMLNSEGRAPLSLPDAIKYCKTAAGWLQNVSGDFSYHAKVNKKLEEERPQMLTQIEELKQEKMRMNI